MKNALKIFFVILTIAAIIFLGFVPQMIDKSMNVVTKKSPFPKQKYYDSIPFIADLHCDALLWDRNLLKKNDHGHVDLPRMIEGNMAMQVFSIVSKTPMRNQYRKQRRPHRPSSVAEFCSIKKSSRLV